MALCLLLQLSLTNGNAIGSLSWLEVVFLSAITRPAHDVTTDLIDSRIVSVDAQTTVEDACDAR
jgi:hypothetical protein